MQLDPADFMSAARMSKDRRERKESRVKKETRPERVRARVPREGLQNCNTEGSGAVHLKCKTLQQKGCRLSRTLLRVRRTQ